MSLADGAHLDQAYWTCDGPNEETDELGCFATLQYYEPSVKLTISLGTLANIIACARMASKFNEVDAMQYCIEQYDPLGQT